MEVGLTNPNNLSRLTGINRSSIYLYLQQLKQKELIVESLISNKTFIKPIDKKAIKKLINSQIDSLKSLEKDLSEKKIEDKLNNNPSFTIFRGVSGATQIVEEIAKSSEDLYFFGSLVGFQNFIETSQFNKLYTTPRRRKMAKEFIITDEAANTVKRFLEESEMFIQRRFLPKGLGTSGSFLCFGNKLVIAQYKPSLSAIVIENPSLVEFFKLSFSSLWKDLEGKNIPQYQH